MNYAASTIQHVNLDTMGAGQVALGRTRELNDALDRLSAIVLRLAGDDDKINVDSWVEGGDAGVALPPSLRNELYVAQEGVGFSSQRVHNLCHLLEVSFFAKQA